MAMAKKQNEDWARRIVRLRIKKLALTQRELADALGVTSATISLWELGKGTPSKLARIAVERLELEAAS